MAASIGEGFIPSCLWQPHSEHSLRLAPDSAPGPATETSPANSEAMAGPGMTPSRGRAPGR